LQPSILTASQANGKALDAQKLDETGRKLAPSMDKDRPVGRWTARGFHDAMKGSQGKPPWIIEHLLLAESATLVSAQPDAMKSLSLLSTCLEAVTKKKVWGHFTANVDTVLFLETEDPVWMVESRIRGPANGLGIGEKEEVPASITPAWDRLIFWARTTALADGRKKREAHQTGDEQSKPKPVCTSYSALPLRAPVSVRHETKLVGRFGCVGMSTIVAILRNY